jgi:hypothetical protein
MHVPLFQRRKVILVLQVSLQTRVPRTMGATALRTVYKPAPIRGDARFREREAKLSQALHNLHWGLRASPLLPDISYPSCNRSWVTDDTCCPDACSPRPSMHEGFKYIVACMA